MCGFIVVVERGRPVDMGRLRRAAAEIRHRGPDHTGEALLTLPGGDGPALHVGIVNHRLSIIDLDPRASLPFRARERTLAYNGEIYNFRELRTGLARRGLRFSTVGDSEVLLAALAIDGLGVLEHANGMWSLALLDEAACRLTAARDRYGKKPLYYHRDGARLVLASEITPILAYLGVRARFEPAAVETYLAHGWLFPGPGTRTHVAGISQLPPGGLLRADLRAWSFDGGMATPLEAAIRAHTASEAELPALIEDAVRARLISDRKVGLLLSGGVDSSLILSVLLARGLERNVHCFTGDAGKSEDAEYARRCLAAAGIEATTIPLDYGAASVERFLDVCRHQEKPFPLIGNVLSMPAMYEAIAAHGVPVVLDGTGGDEIFGGYWDRTWPLALADALARGDHSWLAAMRAENEDEPRVAAMTAETLARLRTCPAAGILGPALGYVALEGADARHLLRNDLGGARSSDPLAGFMGTFEQGLTLDATAGRLQEWLWQNDRNAMLASVENRSPLLDYRLAPFLLTGRNAKLVGPWNKYELRRVFAAFVPLPTQWRRQKQGFRWVHGRFLRHNRARVLELIAAAAILKEHIRVQELIEQASVSDAILESELTQRALCLAGLEVAMHLAP
jgi:asparagine synthase (glutamine-hydrolysing)